MRPQSTTWNVNDVIWVILSTYSPIIFRTNAMHSPLIKKTIAQVFLKEDWPQDIIEGTLGIQSDGYFEHATTNRQDDRKITSQMYFK